MISGPQSPLNERKGFDKRISSSQGQKTTMELMMSSSSSSSSSRASNLSVETVLGKPQFLCLAALFQVADEAGNGLDVLSPLTDVLRDCPHAMLNLERFEQHQR
ncbi:unnamed protein product [Mesocestoides corti]|uniref:Uncharacterized protein n=2 Tax=Mesocestoides corti TaxID=53468 RepID=A0A0R3URT6_MESCO|nr:unnamed protein product [Mesocestoides corti]